MGGVGGPGGGMIVGRRRMDQTREENITETNFKRQPERVPVSYFCLHLRNDSLFSYFFG